MTVVSTSNFQERVARWMLACFTPEIAADIVERNDRFIEEALELVQANGYTAPRAHALVDYVFGRAVGDPDQEAGGVMVTLAALCNTADLDMMGAAEREIARIEVPAIMDKIRAKQASKPTGSALPIASTPLATTVEVGGVDREEAAKIIRREMENNSIPAKERSLRAVDAIMALFPSPPPTREVGGVPDGWVLVPREPPVELLVSMAVRQDHGLGLPGYYDQPIFSAENVAHHRRMESALSDMRKLYEEVVGDGFYAPEHAERYRDLIPPAPPSGEAKDG